MPSRRQRSTGGASNSATKADPIAKQNTKIDGLTKQTNKVGREGGEGGGRGGLKGRVENVDSWIVLLDDSRKELEDQRDHGKEKRKVDDQVDDLLNLMTVSTS